MVSTHPDTSERQTLAEVSAVLDQLEPAYEVINKRQRELLDLQLAGEHERANERLNLLNDLQLGVQTQRELVSSKMAAWSAAADEGRRATRAARLLADRSPRRYPPVLLG
jgi:hypothetical protein